MPEESYVSSREIFRLVRDIDTKVTTLVNQAENLAKRAEEDRQAMEKFAGELDTLRGRFYMLMTATVLVSAGIASWSDLIGLFGK